MPMICYEFFLVSVLDTVHTSDRRDLPVAVLTQLYKAIMHRHTEKKAGIDLEGNRIPVIQYERVTFVSWIMAAPNHYSFCYAGQSTIERSDEISNSSIWIFTRQGATGMRPS